MNAINTWQEPFLPWVESENDRRFKRYLITSLVVFMLLGIIWGNLPVPEEEQQELQPIPPRLAKLILEKKKQPPPPVVKPKTKKKEVTKKKTTKKKTAKKKPQTKKQKTARKVAESAGLVALSDELADLRESFDMDSLQDNRLQQKVGKAAVPTTKSSAVLTAKATKGSGGINTSALSRNTGGQQLASRSTTNVTSTIPSRATSSKRSGSGRTAGRGEEEIERVFQKNKGAIFSLYNRALRKDPSLQGKVVMELTIAPNGKVVKCRIVSSELNDPILERKLVARVKLFRFTAKDVAQVTVSYPIDFLPS
ncbi:MAG: TonB family protein [Gammaproteobacteria bacterium]|nr:TonB family protein [Gammaproteobacteria bacterium]